MFSLQRKSSAARAAASNRPPAGLLERVAEADALLVYAAEHSPPLPESVVDAVTCAKHAVASDRRMSPADELRFFNAYSVLSSNKMADAACRKYRYGLYSVLGLLLSCQIYFVAGSLIVSRLDDVEDEWTGKVAATAMAASAANGVPAQLQPVAPVAAPAPQAGGNTASEDPSGDASSWAKLRRFGVSQANYQLGVNMLPFFVAADIESAVLPDAFPQKKAQFMANYMKLRAELQLVLMSLSGYLLPLLYGLLGAFAYVFRKLSDPAEKLSFSRETESSYTFRLHIGGLGGLAVGWFVSGSQPASGAGALSPLALAFAAGYGSDLLFALLDKVVGAFSLPGGLQSSLRSEVTQRGGMTITTQTQREAKVSDAPDPAEPPSSGLPGRPASGQDQGQDRGTERPGSPVPIRAA